MRIAFNAMFWNQPTVGSGQYLRGLLDGLRRVAPEHEYLLLLPTYRWQTADGRRQTADGRRQTEEGTSRGMFAFILHPLSFGAPSIVSIPTPFDGTSENLAKLWFEQIGVPLAARRLRADVLHVPYFAPPLISPVPVVATVLDIIPLLLPEYRGGAAVRAYTRLVAQAARQARHVIAISDDSRRDIVAHLGCAPAQVSTIYLAAAPQLQPLDSTEARTAVQARYNLAAPFVYYVGGLDTRKNVPTLLRAWARLRQAGGPPATLAIAGRALGGDLRLFPDLDGLIAELGIGASVHRIDVPHEHAALLFNAATLFAYPSRYEGFGLPPLEAMACGTPAVVADASSLPEVVGDAALRVPPNDVSGWTTALWRLLADARLRDELRQRGLERARLFSYERTARETLAVYE